MEKKRFDIWVSCNDEEYYTRAIVCGYNLEVLRWTVSDPDESIRYPNAVCVDGITISFDEHIYEVECNRESIYLVKDLPDYEG